MKKALAVCLLFSLILAIEPVFCQHVLLLKKTNSKKKVMIKNNNKIKYLLQKDTVNANIKKIPWIKIKEIRDSSLLLANGQEIMLNDIVFIYSRATTSASKVVKIITLTYMGIFSCIIYYGLFFAPANPDMDSDRTDNAIMFGSPILLVDIMTGFAYFLEPGKTYNIKSNWKALIIEKCKSKKFVKESNRQLNSGNPYPDEVYD